MRTFFPATIICAAVLLTSGMAAQQAPAASPKPAGAPAAAPKTTPQATPAPTYRLIGTIKDIMLGLVDPAADDLWAAVSTEVTAQGIVEHQPKTNEEWAEVEHDALLLAEAANLLKMPERVVARPEELHGKSTVDPAELTPAQITDKLARSRATWIKYADMLQGGAVQALKFAHAKDPKGIFDAGEQIYAACVSCHQTYWYPGSVEPSQQRAQPSPKK